MFKEISKVLAPLCILVIILIGGFFGFYYKDSHSYIHGTIISKYRNGDNNHVFHLVIETPESEKPLDLTLNEGLYNQYDVPEKVYVDYNFFREVKYIQNEG